MEKRQVSALTKILPTETDLREIASFYKSCFNEPEKGENWTNETAHSYFLERNNEGSLFATLTNENNDLIGICCGSDYKNSFISNELEYDFDKCFYISLIAIKKDKRHKGLGSHMLSQYCDIIKSHTYQNIIVRCRAENLQMRGALKQNGFDEIRTYNATLGGVTCKRIISYKALTHSK